MAPYLIILLVLAVSRQVTSDCALTYAKNHWSISCDNITYEDYLEKAFTLRTNIIDSMGVTRAEIAINIFDSYVPTIDEWLFLPWDDNFFYVNSIKIKNSSVNTVKAYSKISLIERLDLSGNDNISDYKFLSKMKKLRFLHLNHNKLTQESYFFTYLQKEHTHLDLVELNHCNLEKFHVVNDQIGIYDLSFNPNLTILYFKNCYRAPMVMLRGHSSHDTITVKNLKTASPIDSICVSLDLSHSIGSFDFLLSNNLHISEKIILRNNSVPSLNATSFNFNKLISPTCSSSRISIDLSSSHLLNISSNYFASLMLDVLDLSNNQLFEFNGEIFRDSDIWCLDISNSRVSSISPNAFSGLTVNTLNLSKNNISFLEEGLFDLMRSVIHIDLSSNPSIKSLSEKSFQNCRNLESLNLANNVFIKYSGAEIFSNIPSLKSLTLSFKDKNFQSATIKNMYVSELILANTTLERLDPGQFRGFYKLKKLTFIDSMVSFIDSAAFEGLYNLRRINNLKQTGKYNIDAVSHLYSIEFLDLSHHELKKLGNELKNLHYLKKLNLSSNEISSVEIESFATLKQLEILSLSHNQLSVLTVGTFQELNKLTHLYLNQNHLQQLSPGIFSGLDQIVLLDLSQNDLLRTKPHLVFGISMPNLAYLNLEENGLGNEYAKGDDVIRKNEFSIIANHISLQSINIDKNGWRCSTLVDVLATLRSKHITANGTNKGYTVTNIDGIRCS